jgi:hypothetical protein
MQKHLCIAIFVCLIAASSFCAKAKSPQSNAVVQGTILSVQKENVQSPEVQGGTNPTDAPLQSSFYAYNMSIRVGCNTYVGRYETPFEYFPSAFVPNHSVNVRLTHHVMYFNVPGEHEMKMAIVRRKLGQAACSSGS